HSALARGLPPFEVARYANAAAAISVTRHGGSSAPTNREIQTFLSHAADPSDAGRTQKANA
ncbi:ribokinase, partial [Mesorhizobium sp. M7D.F.Ca.US.004.03.1.1]